MIFSYVNFSLKLGFKGLTIIDANYKKALILHNSGRSKAALEVVSQFSGTSLSLSILHGVILRSIGKYSVAEILFRRLLNDGIEDPVIRINLANILIDMGRCDSAVSVLESVSELNQAACRTLGLAFLYNNDFKSAVDVFDSLLQQEPENTDLQWHLSISCLSAGLYERGWLYYESRKRLDKYRSNYTDLHWPELSNLAGASVLIYSEQGFGDNIQFSRFLPMLVDLGARITLVVKPELLRLFGTIKDLEVVREAKSNEFDYVASLLSLPYLLKLHSPADLKLKKRVFELPNANACVKNKLKVGLVWSGKMKPKDRSITLVELSELFKLIEIDLVSLQFDENQKEISKNYLTPFISMPKEDVTDFYDTASIMSEVDLIISIDSAPLHLACMLGVPTIGLLLHSSDWRWQSDDCKQPWYEELTLLRQSQPGCWDKVVSELIKIVRSKVGEKIVSGVD